MTSLSELRFFRTPAHECSYLPHREATTLFADPLAEIDTAMYSALTEAGFRRSGGHIYRPYCADCAACIPVRVPVGDFSPTRRQRRIWRRNTELEVKGTRPCATREIYDLYERYINTRHIDGDMYPARRDQFESFLVDGRPEAVFFEFREQGQLLAVAVADELTGGMSAIYTFFDPDADKRSPGVFAVLWLIEETRRRALPHLYLGYWIKQCQKMNYKVDYRPIEMYINNHWLPAPGEPV